MMKYEEPSMEVWRLEAEDVITSSNELTGVETETTGNVGNWSEWQ